MMYLNKSKLKSKISSEACNLAFHTKMIKNRKEKSQMKIGAEYYMDGSKIVAENRINGGGIIYYIYDVTGITGMIYGGRTYYFERNTLGDIIRVINSTGATVANYSYDAWGNILTKSGSMADVNPFRYRGYYYDIETGFYYLQTRYYDPSIRMFINADNYDIIATLAEKVGQLNLYAYCNNNPIMYTDETGEGLWMLLFACLLVATLAGIDGGTSANISGGSFWKGFVVGFFGGILGFFIGIIPVLGPAGPYLGRLVSSAFYDIINPLAQKGRIDKDDWVNLLLDLSLDLYFSSAYADLFGFDGNASLITNLWKCGVGATIDGVIDISQTQIIYNNITRAMQNQGQDRTNVGNNIKNTNDITRYYIVGA